MRDGPAILKARAGEPVALEGVAAKGRIEGLLFELEVEQRYRNPSETNIEAVYSFPLPWGAVLLDVAFEIGGKKLAGIVVERPKAEAKYETAIERGDSAILLEQATPGLYTVNLGNLMAGEAAVVRYRYAQLLRFEQGQVRVTVPTVIAPRYGDAAAARLQPHQVPNTDLEAAYAFDLSLDIVGELAAGRIGSPSHAIESGRAAETVSVRLARSGHLDRDFVLTIDGLEGRPLTLLARDSEGYVALASFCPPLPETADAEPVNLKILLDCSGSMAGDSIRAAKAALRHIIEQFAGEDRFSLSRFGTEVEHFFQTLVAADDATVSAAASHVAALDADMGGTEMERALLGVLALRGDARSRDLPVASADVLLITDGQIWQAESLLEAARAAGSRIFAIAIGAAPSENMLHRLAEGTGGACEFVAPNEDAEGAILRMFRRIGQPRARDLSTTWPTPPDWTLPFPAAFFEGETLHCMAGFRERPIGQVALSYRVEGQGTPARMGAAMPASLTDGNRVARIAAAMRLPGLDVTAATELAVHYQLVTKHTSCVILHERAEGEKAKSMPELQQIAQMLPAGWGGVGSVRTTMASIRFSDWENTLGEFEISAASPLRRRLSGSRHRPISEVMPSELLRRIARTAVWSPLGRKRLPTSIDALARLGVPEEVLAILRELVREGKAEERVLATFLVVLAATLAGDAFGRLGRRQLRSLAAAAESAGALHDRLRLALAATTADAWNLRTDAKAGERPPSVSETATSG